MPGSAPPFQPRVTLAPNALKAALAAITQACARIRAAGKPAGILAPAEADARCYFAIGFSFVAIGSDVGILAAGSTALAARMREAIDEPYRGPAV
jgi:2-keto-3-deoxy-L-rhamnonate aldolase RhmA